MALRTLLQPTLWTPAREDTAPPLLQAIRDTRKGQADLSQELGERVREAVELLIQGHGEGSARTLPRCRGRRYLPRRLSRGDAASRDLVR